MRTAETKRDSGVPMPMTGLPVDQPTVAGQMRRVVSLQLTETSAAGTLTVSFDTIAGLLSKQLFGGTTTFARYVIYSIAAWGAAGDGTALSIIDETYGITAVDTGSFAFRPKVGIFFPPSTRTVRSTSSTGSFCTISTAPDEANINALIKVEVWTLAEF
jgi:hypothetical protein